MSRCTVTLSVFNRNTHGVTVRQHQSSTVEGSTQACYTRLTMSAAICKTCRFGNPSGFRFCGQCGARLGTAQGKTRGKAEGQNETEGQGKTEGAPMGVAEVSPRYLSTDDPSAAHSAAGTLQGVVHRHAERRQLTVLFCDLVGSTSLSQQLDPEDLRTVVRGYQRVVQPAIERHEGFVSRFLGDGVLAIFGYPNAHEDDASRAVGAAQEVIEALPTIDWQKELGRPLELGVRIGIATGLVVAGDLIGKDAAEEEAVIGETPNLAARLQSLAEPGTVIISDLTRRLLSRRFRTRSLGERVLKGFRQPVPVWQVEGAAVPTDRFASRRSHGSVPLVNRYEELGVLRSLWSEARQGSTGTVLVTGEAGIGKSRVIEALRDHIALENHFYLRFQCSAYHVNTALFPLIVQFERLAQIERSDSPTLRRDKLRGLLRTSGIDTDEALPAMAALLGIPGGPIESFESLSARDKRAATLEAIHTQIAGLSRVRPVLVVMEDIHWSDPTTLELIALCGAGGQGIRLLLVATERAEKARGPVHFPEATLLNLTRLSQEHSSELVRTVAATTPMAQSLIHRIVTKADGVALFVEELTRTLMLSAKEAGPAGHKVRDLAAHIPETLHDLLMARLDSLGVGKRIAQIAAVIGRMFSEDLLSRIIELDARELQQGLRQLTASGLVLVEDNDSEALYSFKHALVRDTAYHSLLRRERRDFHSRIAAALEAREGDVTPELLARHHTEAFEHEAAIHYWMKAGKAASQRSAHLEAVQHFQQALTSCHLRPGGGERDRLELEILVNLGPMLMATSGSASAEAEDTYRRAVALTEQLPVSEDHFTALWGWWRLSKNFNVGAERADRLQALAEKLGDDGLMLQAHHCQWADRFHLGDHASSEHHVAAGLELYADRDYRSHAARFGGHDPRACALGQRVQILWLTGHPQQAVTLMRRARLWARELRQSGSEVHVMDMNLLLLRYQRDSVEAERQARELELFATEHRFAEYLLRAQVFQGWAQAKRGQLDAGIETMRRGIASQRELGTGEDLPVWLEMLADAYHERGDYASGLSVIEEAFAHTEETGVRFWLAELHRCEGELRCGMGAVHTPAAWRCFEQAMAIAASQGARSLELRSIMSLLTLAQDTPAPTDDARQEALRGLHRRLQRLLAHFDPDDVTPEVVDARRRLDTRCVPPP